MDNNQNNIKDFFKRNGFSVVLCSTIAALLIATLYFSYSSFQASEEGKLVKNDDDLYNIPVDKSDVKSYTENLTEIETIDLDNGKTENINEAPSETTTKNLEQTQNTKENSKSPSNVEPSTNFTLFDESKEMTWPVSGQIVMDFSTETSIYDKTLELYRTNDSIAIASPVDSDVIASAEGIVEDIFNDNEKGKSVVINHGNGWKSTYSQLKNEINVDKGQIVKEGQVIGKIGTPSNYSVLLGPHLNFKITKDDVASDPKLILAQVEE